MFEFLELSRGRNFDRDLVRIRSLTCNECKRIGGIVINKCAQSAGLRGVIQANFAQGCSAINSQTTGVSGMMMILGGATDDVPDISMQSNMYIETHRSLHLALFIPQRTTGARAYLSLSPATLKLPPKSANSGRTGVRDPFGIAGSSSRSSSRSSVPPGMRW